MQPGSQSIVAAGPAGVAAEPRGHALAAAVLGLLSAGAALLVVVLLIAADQPEGTSGDLAVVFPPGTGEAEALAAVVDSDGVIRRRGPLGPVWQVTSTADGFAGRLRERGALLVLPAVPFPSLDLGGCSYLPPGSYDRPATAKLRAGPM